MSILDIKNLTHMYDNKVLFDDASLSINNGEHLGVVGLNGAGKTTFINIIAGKLLQDAGEVKWLNGVRRGYLDQHADIDREMTVMEYLKTSFGYLYDIEQRMNECYMKMTEDLSEGDMNQLIDRAAKMQDKLMHDEFYDLEPRIKKVANGLGVNGFGYDTVIRTLSGGQRAKLVLSKLLLENLDIMLLDEPTNFLDIEHIDWLMKFLNDFEGTILVISHDTLFLDKVCRGVVNIENGIIKKYSGNYQQFLAQREQNAKQYEESYLRQQREIEKMETYIAKNRARASTAGMANSRKKMLEKIEVIKKPVAVLDADISFPCTDLVTKDLLVIKELEIGYNGKALLPPINMHIASGSKVWIRGTNGIGKSTFIKTILRKIPPVNGKFHFHIASNINYLEQDSVFNDSSLNALVYINSIFPRMNNKDQRSLLARVGIKGDLATRPICKMSGGEQVRVRMSVLMNIESNILVLDEPTNHLDIRAKESLKEALKEYEGTIILVSHEQDFAEDICNITFDVK